LGEALQDDSIFVIYRLVFLNPNSEIRPSGYVEDSIELSYLKDLVDLRVYVAKPKVSASLACPLVNLDQKTEEG
jgi:hypothetical protein